jgi:hypothetical protein
LWGREHTLQPFQGWKTSKVSWDEIKDLEFTCIKLYANLKQNNLCAIIVQIHACKTYFR